MTTKTLVNKSVNEELKQATFIVLVPNEVDLQGDTYDEDEVRKACHSFNKFSRQPNLFHVTKTTTFEFAESYLAPVDFTIDDFEVKKGTWLATIQVNSDELWELIKSGDVSGLSISAMASGINLEDE